MLSTPTRIWCFISIIFIVALSGLSITNSSIAQLDYSSTLKTDGLIFGQPRSIRSDEYLRWTPEFIGQSTINTSGSIFDYKSSSTYKNTESSIQSKLIQIISIDKYLKEIAEKLLPINFSFAIHWWYYPFLAICFLPLFLQKLHVPLKYGIPTSFLVFFSPSNQWWSNGQVQIIGISSLGFYLLIKVVESKSLTIKHKLLTTFYAFLSIGLISRLPFEYQPWSIPIASFFVVITATKFLLEHKIIRNQISKFFLITFAIIIVVATRIWTYREQFRVLANTVYPGQRRTLISSADYSLFSTPLTLRLYEFGNFLKIGNPSEASIAFVEIAFLLITLLPALLILRKVSEKSKLMLPLSLLFTIFFLWTVGWWPNWLLTLNPLTLVPQNRMAQILGTLSLIALPLMLQVIQEIKESTSHFLNYYLNFCFCIIFLLIIFQLWTDNLSFTIGEINNFEVYSAISILLVIYVTLFIVGINKFYYYWVFALFVTLMAAPINPIQYGVGDIFNSELAKSIRNIDSNNYGLWASNDRKLDAILIANTNSTLSGQQNNGPNETVWLKLDPTFIQRDIWNRGSSSVTVNWTTDEGIYIDNPVNDVIQININPCNPVARELNLNWILSNSELNFTCLNEIKVLTGPNETNYFIYRLIS